MLDREKIAAMLEGRIMTVVREATGLTRPTLRKLQRNTGKVNKATQKLISVYLEPEK